MPQYPADHNEFMLAIKGQVCYRERMIIRVYNPITDYSSVEALYKDSSTFGGQFDQARDSEERLKDLIEKKPDAILVAEDKGEIIGTVTLFEDGRSAWLYRFAVKGNAQADVISALWAKAREILKQKGHTQVLVYAPVNNKDFEDRYTQLGFIKGNDFTAYWQDLG